MYDCMCRFGLEFALGDWKLSDFGLVFGLNQAQIKVNGVFGFNLDQMALISSLIGVGSDHFQPYF